MVQHGGKNHSSFRSEEGKAFGTQVDPCINIKSTASQDVVDDYYYNPVQQGHFDISQRRQRPRCFVDSLDNNSKKKYRLL
jgi:hypothetical protein